MAAEAGSIESVTRFHTRYAMFIMSGYVVLMVVFSFLVINQYRLNAIHDREVLENHFAERVAHLDSLLSTVTILVDGMRSAAEFDLRESAEQQPLVAPTAFAYLAEAPAEKRYHQDSVASSSQREDTGNLTGEGSLDGRTRDFYREIHMALRRNPQFRAIQHSLKEAAWIYYTSANRFINVYPWVSSREFRFSGELYTHGFYSLGLPENNPGRELVWTEVYVDEYGKGLMTTCTAPVYDGERFVGTVAIDLTVDFLNTIVKAFQREAGEMFVVNERGQLVAHPSLITSMDERTRTMNDVLPPELRSDTAGFGRLPEGRVVKTDAGTVIKRRLKSAPWTVAYLEPEKSKWTAISENLGLGVLGIIGVLPVLVIAALVVAHRAFVVPAEQFAEYIMARSRQVPVTMGRRVPGPWRPWFDAVEDTFRENEKLAGEIQRQKADLEVRVRERTEALAASNDQLRREIEERKQAETALREGEERYRRIFENIVDTYFETGIEGTILEISPSIETISQYRREDLIGRSVYDIYVDPGIRDQLVRRLLETGRISNFDVLMRDKDGSEIPCAMNSVLLRDSQGRPTKTIGSIRNMREKKEAEIEKERLEARLQRAEKMEAIGTLAGGVAHDLNNILSGIVSYPDLLLLDLPEGSPLRKPIETIKHSGEKATAIVQDLLTLARRGIVVADVVDLNRLIRDYLASPEHSLLASRHGHIRFDLRLSPDLLPVTGSAVHLTKTVMNLVGNAAEAISDGGTVVIATENRYVDSTLKGFDKVSEGDYAVVTVADDGEGIQPEDMDKIFEPFYTKKKMGRSGTGLGMAVVWGTVKDHRGYIDIDSSPGRGTTIAIYLPVTRKGVSPSAPAPSMAAYHGRERILVVDDVKEQRDVAKTMLSRMGYTVVTARSGEEAVEYLKRETVDLVVLDMIMEPGMDGLDTYSRILKLHPVQKAIIASGYSETDRVRETQRLGAGTYVRKPYLMETICRAVREELDR